MANKRHKPEEIVTKLRQVDVLVGQGMARVDPIVGTVRLPEEPIPLTWEQYQNRVQARIMRLARTASAEDLEMLKLAEAWEGLDFSDLDPASAGLTLAENSEALMAAILPAQSVFPLKVDQIRAQSKPEDAPTTLGDLLVRLYPKE